MNRRSAISTASAAILGFITASTDEAIARRRHRRGGDTYGAGRPKEAWPEPDKPNTEQAAEFDRKDKSDIDDLIDKITNVWLPLLDASRDGTKTAVDALENPLARETLRLDLIRVVNLLKRKGS